MKTLQISAEWEIKLYCFYLFVIVQSDFRSEKLIHSSLPEERRSQQNDDVCKLVGRECVSINKKGDESESFKEDE